MSQPQVHIDAQTLIAELDALKRRMRFYGRSLAAVAAICAGAAALFMAGPLHSQATKLVVQQLDIVDASGATRAVFSGENGLGIYNSALAFYNAANQRRMLFNVSDNEPTIYFLDDAGKTRMYMDVSAAGASRFSMADDQNKQRVFITVDAQKIPAVILNGEDGNRRFVANVEKGEPTMGFYEGNGNFRMYVNGGNFPRLMMFDAEARQRNVMAVDDKGLPFFRLNDPAGNQRVLLNFENDAGHIFFKDAAGTDIAKLPAP